MGWLVDHAGTVYLLLGLVMLGCVAAFLHTRRLRYLGAVVVIFGVIGLFWLLTSLVVTDRKQMVASMKEMADAVLEHKADKVLQHLASDFKYSGLTREQVAAGVVETAKNYRVTNYHIWKQEFEAFDRDKGSATLAFNIRVDHSGDQSFFGLCRATFALDKASGKWRVREFQVYNPVVNTNQPIHIPIGR